MRVATAIGKAARTAALLGVAAVSASPSVHLSAVSTKGQTVGNVLMAIPNLTAEQRKRITDLVNVARMRSAPFRQELFTARRELARVWAADKLDQQFIMRKEAAVGQAAGKAKLVWNELFVQLHDLLSSSQRRWLALHGAGLYGATDGIPDFTMSTGPYCPCAEQP